jgi:hypothetical protein
VLRGARDFLVPGGLVFLSISTQYGQPRIANLVSDAPGFAHGGLLATTDWVSFDLNRTDLLDCLHGYAQNEQRGGLAYEFVLPTGGSEDCVTAQAAIAWYKKTGQSPLSKWQTHLFKYNQSAKSG